MCINVNYKHSLWKSNLLQIEPCNDSFVVNCDFMEHCFEMIKTLIINKFLQCKENELKFLMIIISNHYGRKCLINLLQLEPCNDIFKVISDIMAHWFEIIIPYHNKLNAAIQRK